MTTPPSQDEMKPRLPDNLSDLRAGNYTDPVNLDRLDIVAKSGHRLFTRDEIVKAVRRQGCICENPEIRLPSRERVRAIRAAGDLPVCNVTHARGCPLNPFHVADPGDRT